MSDVPSPRITLRDIAKRLGLAHSTVSDALRDSSRVAPALRATIQKTALEMGYRPNPMAAALGHLRQHQDAPTAGDIIAWINYWNNPDCLRGFREFDLYWKGASQAAEQRGYRLEPFACHGYSAARLEQILRARNIRGVLLPPHQSQDLPKDWNEIGWTDFSVVRFGYSLVHPRVHVVTGNHVTSGILAFENMLRLGYKRVGLITSEDITTRDKAGYLTRQLELPSAQRLPVLILPLPRERSAARMAVMVDWLKTYKPDCILTAIACVRKYLEEAGYRIPGDIGMAAFSVLDGGVDAGIDQNSEKVGETAVETLCSLMKQGAMGIPDHPKEILIESRWVDGSSLPPV
jgi:DNA-binding LacI/PurR family transcriptional regulator